MENSTQVCARKRLAAVKKVAGELYKDIFSESTLSYAKILLPRC